MKLSICVMTFFALCQYISFSVYFLPATSTLSAYKRNAIQIQSRGQNGSIELTCLSLSSTKSSELCSFQKQSTRSIPIPPLRIKC